MAEMKLHKRIKKRCSCDMMVEVAVREKNEISPFQPVRSLNFAQSVSLAVNQFPAQDAIQDQ